MNSGETLLKITIWDNDVDRMAAIDQNLYLAMKELNLRGTVDRISEPPLLARENLLNRVPVLEIEDRYWSLKPGRTISQSECRQLLAQLFGSRSGREATQECAE